mgnify:CR=1 FL=1
MSESEINRRAVLGIVGTGALSSLAGCSTILGESNDGNNTEKLPKPEIVDVTAEVTNFRQNQEHSTTYILLQNNGGLGELKLTIKAKGDAAIYDDGEQVFSLEAGQEFPTRFELFTHEGAKELEINVHSTEEPDNRDTYTVTEDDADDIEYAVGDD